MIQSQETIELIDTSIQFRLNSSNSSGLVNTINSTLNIFSLHMCKIIGSNLMYNQYNGYISSTVLKNVTVDINQLQICINSTLQIGYIADDATFKLQGSIPENRCDICKVGTVSYGICVDNLEYAQIKDEILQCIYPFEYVDSKCQCAYGYVLNVSICVDLIDKISKLVSSQDQNLTIQQMQQNMYNMILNQQNINVNLETSIAINSSFTKFTIQQNLSLLEQNIINNIMIFQNRRDEINYTLMTNITAQNSMLIPIQAKIDKYTIQPSCGHSNSTNITEINFNLTICDLPQYSTSFDIVDISYNIFTSDYDKGYVFSSSVIIQNTYISIQKSVYNNIVSPLFQTQGSFLNLKIEIKQQIIGTGSILTPSQQRIECRFLNFKFALKSNIFTILWKYILNWLNLMRVFYQILSNTWSVLVD
ncbi:Hypothetical_protein [Hexamita inflata]|uniref:Hypothetical_protein n=1 Tax=Hexamita inflata TaxID=28002 RepID=A0ABP1IL08_9EUKA